MAFIWHISSVQFNTQRVVSGLILHGRLSYKHGSSGILKNAYQTVVGNPMDGLFEIMLLEKVDTASLIAAGLAALDKKFHHAQTSTVIQTDKAEIIFDKPRLLQLDGEVIQKYEKLQVELLKSAVKFITTKDNSYYKN